VGVRSQRVLKALAFFDRAGCALGGTRPHIVASCDRSPRNDGIEWLKRYDDCLRHMPHSLVVLATHRARRHRLGGVLCLRYRVDRLSSPSVSALGRPRRSVLFAIVPTGYEGTDPATRHPRRGRFGTAYLSARSVFCGSSCCRSVRRHLSPSPPRSRRRRCRGSEWQLFYIERTRRDAPIIVAVTVLMRVVALLLRDPRLRIAGGACAITSRGSCRGLASQPSSTDYIAVRLRRRLRLRCSRSTS